MSGYNFDRPKAKPAAPAAPAAPAEPTIEDKLVALDDAILVLEQIVEHDESDQRHVHQVAVSYVREAFKGLDEFVTRRMAAREPDPSEVDEVHGYS